MEQNRESQQACQPGQGNTRQNASGEGNTRQQYVCNGTDDKHLYDLVDPKDNVRVLEEVALVASLLSLGGCEQPLTALHEDIVRLFSGRFPGYRRSTTKYHNLEHTCAVVLATARLLHGCVLDGILRLSERDFLLCVMAAYFHDTGMIQEEGDTEGTGAKYTVGHEQRSIVFMERYLASHGYAEADIRSCADMIRCTILSLPPENIVFSADGDSVLGCIVGAADLLAQMADRTYLEKLHLLFQEFEEAKLPGFSSEQELIMQTEAFYTNVAKKRLEGGLKGLYTHMRSHFRERWGRDEDLYATSIEANIRYISDLANACRENPACYEELLRRRVGPK